MREIPVSVMACSSISYRCIPISPIGVFPILEQGERDTGVGGRRHWKRNIKYAVDTLNDIWGYNGVVIKK